MKLALLAASIVEVALNQALSLDPDTGTAMGALSGKVIGFACKEFNTTLTILPGAGKVQVLSEYAGEHDTLLSGTLLAFAQLALSDDKGTLFSGAVEVSGDLALGEQFQTLLAQLDIDWEELSSHFIGDVGAHQLGSWIRRSAHWSQAQAQTLRMDFSEYLLDEKQLVIRQEELEHFYQQVDDSRDAVERLAARIAQLRQQLGNNS